MNRFIGIVPARGGSKGIKKKNIIDLHGIPLIAHTLLAAKDSNLTEFYVTTDDSEISSTVSRYGVQVIDRPAELAKDDTTTVDTIRHAVENLSLDEDDYIVLLQPTSPLRNVEDINAVIDRLKTGKNCVVSFFKAESEHPYYMYYNRHGKLVPVVSEDQDYGRQSHPEVLVRNGCIYAIRVREFMKFGTFVIEDTVAYIMPKSRSINIDSYEDLKLVRSMLNGR